MPPEPAGLPGLLLLVGGFGVLFFAAGVYAMRRVLSAASEPAAPPETPVSAPAWLTNPAGMEHLPAMSATLPFLLLIMIVLRLPLPGPSAVFGLALLLGVLLLGLARILENGILSAVAGE